MCLNPISRCQNMYIHFTFPLHVDTYKCKCLECLRTGSQNSLQSSSIHLQGISTMIINMLQITTIKYGRIHLALLATQINRATRSMDPIYSRELTNQNRF